MNVGETIVVLVAVTSYLTEYSRGVHQVNTSYQTLRQRTRNRNLPVRGIQNLSRQNTARTDLRKTTDFYEQATEKWMDISATSRVKRDDVQVVSAPGPPPDYKEIAGLGYYKVHRDRARWETARRRCSREGAHLLVLNSALEAAAVVAASGLPGWSWLGFDDYSAHGEDITLLGTTLEEAGYAAWDGRRPGGDAHCGVVSNVGLLGAADCRGLRDYICEFRSADEDARKQPRTLPIGYRQLGGLGAYRLHRDAVQWETARRRCEAEGAHLFVPNSDEEAAAVLRTLGMGVGGAWVGFDDFSHLGHYVYFDGQQLGAKGVYTRYAPTHPMRDGHCGFANKDGLIGVLHCHLKLPYICELYGSTEKPEEPAPASAPPPGYVALGNTSFYHVHRDRVPWETARRRCAAEGAHLVVPNSRAEAEVALGASGLGDWFWVGFDDYDAEGEYVTVQGTRLVDCGYMMWHVGNSEPTRGCRCGIAKSNGLLGTGSCSLRREFVCEWDRPSVGPQPPPSLRRGYADLCGLGLYKVHRDRAPWETARRRCAAEGAHLLVLNSQAEADAVLGASGLPGWMWVGFDDFDVSSEYVTVLGTRLYEAGYQKWHHGEPNKKYNCGAAKWDGYLSTGNCAWKREYICEMPKDENEQE